MRPDDPRTQIALTDEESTEVRHDREIGSMGPISNARYRIMRRIGKGGMGEVMSARDEQIGRDVAVKRMRAANPNERQVARFLREACIQGRLEHPAIVPVHEIGKDEQDLPFFAMKKLAGTSLLQLLAGDRTTFPMQRVLRAFTDVCLAVEFAHVRGVIHRDLKPDNIMLGDFGEVYVLDWGVAKILGEEEDHEFADIGSGSGEFATGVGTAIGTPGYMAPEQVRGELDIDGRADVYTLGCLLFEILSGEALHPRGKLGMDAAVAANFDARPSHRPGGKDVAPELDELCVHATRANRDERLATARELGDRVQRYLDGDRDLALRRNLARAHLDAATAAFERGDSDEQRRIAMREAAAALALDPSLAGAAELVGRLMLEPPKTTPKDVLEAVHRDEVKAAKANARAGMVALLAGVAFSPLNWWIAPSGSLEMRAYMGVLAACGLLCWLAIRGTQPRPGLIILGNVLMVGLVARMYSPILIAPAVAAVLGMAMMMTPRFSWLGSGPAVASLFTLAVLVPWALERLGIVSLTISVDATGVMLAAPGFVGDEGPTIMVGVLYIAALIAGAVAMGDTMRARNRAAAQHLHLQAWQLRQLVPH